MQLVETWHQRRNKEANSGIQSKHIHYQKDERRPYWVHKCWVSGGKLEWPGRMALRAPTPRAAEHTSKATGGDVLWRWHDSLAERPYAESGMELSKQNDWTKANYILIMSGEYFNNKSVIFY